MYPMLKPALRRSWRDRTSLQFGVDPAHAVVLEPLDDPAARFLSLLDGTRSHDRVRQEAALLGVSAQRADRLLDALARGGVLDDARGAGSAAGLGQHGTAVERLRPDLASLSVVHPEPGAAAARMAAREEARVQVRGAGRVGAAVAAVLSAAGVGHVDTRDSGVVEPWDTAPCGIPAAQIGERREAAARGAVRRASPDPRRSARSPSRQDAPLHLAVLAPRDGLAAYAPDPREAEPLLAAGIPHLYAGVLEGRGVVGPLVLPGRSACAGCLQAARGQADPAWPRMLAQLRSGRPTGVQACDVALATVVAGIAAAHALAYLDAGSAAGYGLPPSVGGRVEFSLAGLELGTAAVAPHAGCGCGASLPAGRATMAG